MNTSKKTEARWVRDILSWGWLGGASEWPKRLHHVEIWSESILGRRTSTFRDPLRPLGFWWLHGNIFTFSGRWWGIGRPGMLQSMGSPKVEHDLGRKQLNNNNYKLVEEFEFIRTAVSPSPLFPGVNISLHCSHFSVTHAHTYTQTHHSFPSPFDSKLQMWHPFICKDSRMCSLKQSHHASFQIRKSTFSQHSHPIQRRHSNFANCLNYASFLLWSRAPPYALYLIVLSAHFL